MGHTDLTNLLEEEVSFLRIKVRIHCKRCGERFVLRGRMEQGQIQTGFKRCICDNCEFIVEVMENHA
ncbi:MULTISPECIES: hypothetical protein [Paenibacillus]|uniref:hypothetical protein n=1 Tax=Paenibacillus sp. BT-177 TaxID=2986930 RepID=UPI0001E6CE14|nr:hypothetical protein [Paenibacillus sp. BT-177]